MNEHQQSIMTLIAKPFNEAKITWGLGGSALLNILGLQVMVNDLDIMVDAKDFDKAIVILNQIGTEKHKALNPNFKTERFKTYLIENCAVDVMSGICVKHNETWFDFKFSTKHVVSSSIIDSIVIPLMGLEDWYEIYQALDRSDKIKLLNQYMIEKGNENHRPLES